MPEDLYSIEEQINADLKDIHDFNNGNDELVYAVEEVVYGIKKYTHITTSNYIKFKFLELYLDLSIRLVNSEISKSEDYRTLIGYSKEDLQFYLHSAKVLKKYIKKCIKTGDVDNLDSAYLMTIYLSYILENISDYFQEIRKRVGCLAGQYEYFGNFKIREKAEMDIEEIKKLMKNITEEGK